MAINIQSASALTINANYIDAAGAQWSSVGANAADGRVTFEAAISIWESLITTDMIIDVDVSFADFANDGDPSSSPTSVAYHQAQWSCGPCPNPLNLTPDASVFSHTIRFDTADLANVFFDQSPTSADDLGSQRIDALSISLHELGHMLGFADDVYIQDYFSPNAYDPWTSLIDGNNVFDPGGLNILMAGSNNLAHIFQGANPCSAANIDRNLLMMPGICNGTRILPGATELSMLRLAYNYDLAPVPVPAALPLLLSALGGIVALRRRGG
ncbi:MAG: hypothetical protein H6978_09295 [Gammaproteobacteria bacterium]|nr:hypothetical protein [Gammaproteobacteria bacterium]